MKASTSVYIVFTFLVFVSIGCMPNASSDTEEKQPNVLILFSDQHNKSVMGFEGHSDVITPNLDRLANEAFVYDRAYCTTGICAPARSSLLTGIYPRTLGILSNSERTSVMKEVVSLQSLLKKNGYKTYAFGKRHTSLAIDEGWDVHKSHLCNESPGDNYVTWIEAQGYAEEFAHDWSAEFGRGSGCSSLNETIFPTADLGTRLSKLPEGYTMEAFTAFNTIEMIKQQKVSDKPFFCWATFYRPHQPYTPLKKYMDMYDVSKWGDGTNVGSSIKKPESFYEPIENLPPLLQEQRNGGNKVWNMDKAYTNEQIWRDYIGAYYALVTEMDFYVGEIIAALEEAGLKDETIIIYTADHGDFVGNHGMVEKAAMGQNVYEDILNIPLIIRYPGQQNSEKKYELVSQVDVMPTLMDILGIDAKGLKYPLQGKSLDKLMRGEQEFDREFVVSESWSQAAIITKDHKLGIMLDPSDYRRKFDYREFGDMFFDRASDPLETSNQINNVDNSSNIEQLKYFYQKFEESNPDIGKQQIISEHTQK